MGPILGASIQLPLVEQKEKFAAESTEKQWIQVIKRVK